MKILDGVASRLRMRAPSALLTLLFATACVVSAPIPLIAVQGTTFVLMLPVTTSTIGDMPFGSELASTGRPDPQRGELVVGLCPLGQPSCVTPLYYLVTRYVTSFVPDPASPAALSWPGTTLTSGTQAAYTSQAIALLEVPADTVPAEYSLTVRRRFGPVAGQNETRLPYVDPGSIRIVPRPNGVPAAWNPLEARAANLTFSVEDELLRYIPYPSVSVGLSYARVSDIYYWPAAAEFEVIYPAGIEIKGVFEENSPGRGSIVLMHDDPPARTLRITLIDPRRCTPSLRIAYDFAYDVSGEPLRTAPVLPSEFSVVEANTRTYNVAGELFDAPVGSFSVSYAGIHTGVLCADEPPM